MFFANHSFQTGRRLTLKLTWVYNEDRFDPRLPGHLRSIYFYGFIFLISWCSPGRFGQGLDRSIRIHIFFNLI